MVDDPDLVVVARGDGDRLEADGDRADAASAAVAVDAEDLEPIVGRVGREEQLARSATAPAAAPAATRMVAKLPPAGTFLSSAVDSPSARLTVPLHPPRASASDKGSILRNCIGPSSRAASRDSAGGIFHPAAEARCRRKAVSSASLVHNYFDTKKMRFRRTKSQVVHNLACDENGFSVSYFSSATCRSTHHRHVFCPSVTRKILFYEGFSCRVCDRFDAWRTSSGCSAGIMWPLLSATTSDDLRPLGELLLRRLPVVFDGRLVERADDAGAGPIAAARVRQHHRRHRQRRRQRRQDAPRRRRRS